MLLVVAVALVLVAYIGFKLLSRQVQGKVARWHEQAARRGYELDLTHRAPPPLPFDLIDGVGDAKIWTTVTSSVSDDAAHLYKFEVRGTTDKLKHRRSIAVIELPFDAPKTLLRPRALQTAEPRVTDGEDLQIGSDAFDATFRTQGADASFARTLFGSRLGAWLLTDDGRVGDVEFEFRGRHLLCAGPRANSIDELIDFSEWSVDVGRRAAATVDPSPSR